MAFRVQGSWCEAQGGFKATGSGLWVWGLVREISRLSVQDTCSVRGGPISRRCGLAQHGPPQVPCYLARATCRSQLHASESFYVWGMKPKMTRIGFGVYHTKLMQVLAEAH